MRGSLPPRREDVRRYDRRFTWLRRTVSQDAAYGNEPETFTANGYLWGYLRPLSSGEQVAEGVKSSTAGVEIRLMNRPAVLGVDRLQDEADDAVYVIDGAPLPSENNAETVLKAHRYEQPR